MNPCSAWIIDNGRLVETLTFASLEDAMSSEDPFFWYHTWEMNEREEAAE